MKILKIFGLVVAVHMVAFMFVFAIPGCRATRRSSSPPPSAAVQADRDLASRPIGEPRENFQTPAAASSTTGNANPFGSATGATTGSAAGSLQTSTGTNTSTAQVSYAGSVPTVRFNPTRPGRQPATANTQPNTNTAVPEQTSSTSYTVVSGDTLWKIAKQHHITSKELAAANNIRLDAALRPGQKLMVPGKATPTSVAVAPSAQGSGENVSYKVREGDSLALIARRAGTTSTAIKTLNKLRNDTVRVGQTLLIPAGPGTAALLTAAPDTETAAAPRVPASGARHVVQPGENLGIIAKRYGVTRRDLAVANNIVDPRTLRAGQEIVIPGAKTPSTASTPPPVEPAVNSAPVSTTPVESASPIGSDSGQPEPETGSPIAPTSNEPVPPVIQVQDTNPIANP